MRILLVLVLLLATAVMWGEIPSGYYDDAEGKSGEVLKSSLHDIISKGHSALSYTPGVWNAYYDTDRRSDNTIWDMYSDIPGGTPVYTYTYSSDQCGNYSGEGSCYNREHSFPKSWFSNQSPMITDIVHVVPSDGYVNGKRSNFPYGEVDSLNASWTSTNGCRLGACVTEGYSGTVFEPIDEYKGDFARIYFYMATRYLGEDSNWPGSAMVDGAEPKAWALAMLKRWNDADPVSDKERDRNDGIYDHQGNRNPFVDHPEYICSIWGGTDCDSSTTEPIDTSITTPENAQALNLTFDSDLEGCTVVQGTGSISWEHSTYSDKAYLYINTYDEGVNESWVVTPAVNMDVMENPVFTFDISSYNDNKTVADCGDGQFEVYYSTNFDGSTITASEWTRFSSVDNTMLGERWEWVSVDLDVSALRGDEVYFAFVHSSDATNGTTWEVDNVMLSGDLVSSIPEVEPSNVYLYPNPSKGVIHLSSDVNELLIINISGQVVLRKSQLEKKESVDISTLSQGIYFAKVKLGQGYQMIKFVKE